MQVRQRPTHKPVALCTLASQVCMLKRVLVSAACMMAAHRIAVAPLIWGSPWSMRPRTSLIYCCSEKVKKIIIIIMPKSVKRHTNTVVQISYNSVNKKCFHCNKCCAERLQTRHFFPNQSMKRTCQNASNNSWILFSFLVSVLGAYTLVYCCTLLRPLLDRSSFGGFFSSYLLLERRPAAPYRGS